MDTLDQMTWDNPDPKTCNLIYHGMTVASIRRITSTEWSWSVFSARAHGAARNKTAAKAAVESAIVAHDPTYARAG